MLENELNPPVSFPSSPASFPAERSPRGARRAGPRCMINVRWAAGDGWGSRTWKLLCPGAGRSPFLFFTYALTSFFVKNLVNQSPLQNAHNF